MLSGERWAEVVVKVAGNKRGDAAGITTRSRTCSQAPISSDPPSYISQLALKFEISESDATFVLAQDTRVNHSEQRASAN